MREAGPFVCVRNDGIFAERLVRPRHWQNLLIPVVVVPACHRPVPDIARFKALPRLKHERAPAEVAEEEDVRFCRRVPRILVPATHYVTIELQCIHCSVGEHLSHDC